MSEPTPAPAQKPDPPDAAAPAERRVVVRSPCGPEIGARASGPYGEFSCMGRILDASARGLGLLLPHPFAPGAVVVVELTCAGLGYGHAAVARVAHAVARPDGYLLGCSLLSPLPADVLRHLRGGEPAPTPPPPGHSPAA